MKRKYLTVNRTLARRVLKTVDAGLSDGLGKPVPGHMCVEAAVCYAMGLPHNDEPPCVSLVIRHLKIMMNDMGAWVPEDQIEDEGGAEEQARAEGLRRLAIAQLGSNTLDDKKILKRLVTIARRLGLSKANLENFQDRIAKFESVADIERELSKDIAMSRLTIKNIAHNDGMSEVENVLDPLQALYVDADPKKMNRLAEAIVKMLVSMGSPGAAFLDLTE